MNYYKNKLLRKSFCDSKSPLSIFDKKFEDMKRNYKKPPKRESLILYRDVVKACKKFFWKNKDGREWYFILLKYKGVKFYLKAQEENLKNIKIWKILRKLEEN